MATVLVVDVRGNLSVRQVVFAACVAKVEDGSQMPFTYVRDDMRHRIDIAFEGPFQLSEALASIERRRAEDTCSYAVLYDIRFVTGQPDMEQLRRISSADLSIPTNGQTRGPIAIVAASEPLYTKACTAAAMVQPKVNVRVFRDPADADSWLTTNAADHSVG